MRCVKMAALALVAIAFCAATASASAAPPRAAIVLDARNGEVLYESGADRKLHPASLTKMMTLYMVFEAVESGRLSLDARVRVSRHAAAQPPSKMGFRAGQKVRVRDLIRAAAVRSANDSAVVLAEAVAGSESRFAELMTRRAREMGMSRTTFKNASGLTNRGHLSTARDMATLSRRLFYDFPQYYNLFGRKQTKAFGKTIRNTNRLLSSYRGADGIKTGYTRAAGFNLASTAKRGDVRVLAVYFGGRSGAQRNRRVAELLDMGFKRARPHVKLRPPAGALVFKSPMPQRRPGVAPAVSPSLVARSINQFATALGPNAAQAATADPADRAPIHTVDATRRAPKRMPPPPPRPGAASATPGAIGEWAVQLGAFSEADVAIAELASTAFGAMPALKSAGREVFIAGVGDSAIYRARLTGLDRETAREACKRLMQEGRDCVPIPPAVN